MKKTILTLAIAVTLGMTALTATPRPAQAQWWIAPAIAGGVLLGVGIGAAAANPYYAASPYYYYAPGYAYAYQPYYDYAPRYADPSGYVYVRPGYVYAPSVVYVQPRCYYARGYYGRRVRVCE